MDLMQLGAQLLSETMGINADNQTVSSALTSVLGGSNGNVDLAGLASKMASSGELGNIVQSWLGDGANSAISADSIMGLFGENQCPYTYGFAYVVLDVTHNGRAPAVPYQHHLAVGRSHRQEMLHRFFRALVEGLGRPIPLSHLNTKHQF